MCASKALHLARASTPLTRRHTHVYPTQVRTQTLVKNAIVQVDAAPFKQWYSAHYGLEVGLKKRGGAAAAKEAADAKEALAAAASNHVKRKIKQRVTGRKLDQVRRNAAFVAAEASGCFFFTSPPTRPPRCAHTCARMHTIARPHHHHPSTHPCAAPGRPVCRRPRAGVHLQPPGPVRPLRRLPVGGQGARVLHQEDAQEGQEGLGCTNQEDAQEGQQGLYGGSGALYLIGAPSPRCEGWGTVDLLLG